jgi:hypothetical protein
LTCRNCARRTCDDQHHGNGDISDRVFHGFRSYPYLRIHIPCAFGMQGEPNKLQAPSKR